MRIIGALCYCLAIAALTWLALVYGFRQVSVPRPRGRRHGKEAGGMT